MATQRTTVEAEIADDLARSDLTTQITKAVTTAIKAYEEERFFFNEAYAVSVTLSSSVAVLALSALPVRILDLDRVRIKRSTTFYDEIYRRDYGWVMAAQDVITFTIPYEYCIYNEQLMFDSFADQNYTLILDGIKSLGSATSNSYSVSSSIAWFDKAYELIRHRAKREIYMHVVKDTDMAAVAKLAEDDEFDLLKAKTYTRVATGQIRPTEF